MKRIASSILVLVMVLSIPLAATAQDGDELNQYYDGSYWVVMPEGWQAEVDMQGALYMSDNADVMEDVDSDEIPILNSGELAINIVPFSETQLTGVEDASGFLGFFVEVIGNSPDSNFASMGDPVEMTIGSRDVAISEIEGENFQGVGVGALLAPGYWGLAVIIYPEGEREELFEYSLEVLSSVAYSPPLEETYEDELSFNYPTGWVVGGGTEAQGVYFITDSDETMTTLTSSGDLGEGQYAIIFMDATQLVSPEDIRQNDTLLEEFAGALAEELAEEGDEFGDPVNLTLDDQSVIVVTVSNELGDAEGGLLTTITEDDRVYVVLWSTSNGNSSLLFLTAVNFLLSIAPVE